MVNLLTCLNPVWFWSSVCPHRATVNLLQPASTQCGVGPVWCWSSVVLVQCGVGPVWCWSSVVLVQCGVGPVWCWSSVVLVQCGVGPVWCWSSVCPRRAIVNLLQPASAQCGVGPVCVPVELLSTYFNLPQPSVVLVQCVSP